MGSESKIIVGKVGAPFGVSGWQHFQSFTNPIDNLLSYKTIWVGRATAWKEFEVSHCKRHQKGLVAQLKNIDDRDKAALLTNSLIAIERARLAPLEEGEFYWADLEGLSVFNQRDGENIGVVAYLYQNINLDVMVVRNNAIEKHIPFQMHETVLSVDLELKKITIDWDCV